MDKGGRKWDGTFNGAFISLSVGWNANWAFILLLSYYDIELFSVERKAETLWS